MGGTAKPTPNLGTNVPKRVDAQVRRFNELNQALTAGVPEIARASDSLQRHLPLLREMQALLSQRPVQPHGVGGDFTMLHREMGKTIRMAVRISDRDELPTWTQWIKGYSAALDYSVRHIRRLMGNEPRTKTTKKCGWSTDTHNKLIRAATAAFDLVNAIDHNADTTTLVQEIHEIEGSIPRDLIEKAYTPARRIQPARRARRVTTNE